MRMRAWMSFGALALLGCAGAEPVGVGSGGDAVVSGAGGETGDVTAPGASADGTDAFEGVIGTTISGRLPGPPGATYRVVTVPEEGFLWLDPASGELLYRGQSLTTDAAASLTYVTESGGATSAPVTARFTWRPVDFGATYLLRDTSKTTYAYGGSGDDTTSLDCGASVLALDVASTTLRQRSFGPCGAFAPMGVRIEPARVIAAEDDGRGNTRGVSIRRMQVDAVFRYDEDLATCATWNASTGGCAEGKASTLDAWMSTSLAALTGTTPAKLLDTSYEARSGQSLRGALRVSNPEAHLVYYAYDQMPAHGTFALQEDLAGFYYTPAEDFVGTDSFRVAITDRAGTPLGPPATMSVTVTK